MLNNQTYYTFYNLRFLCKNSKGHYLFQYDPKDICKEDSHFIKILDLKIKGRSLYSPINIKQNIIKFNNTKHFFKTGDLYQIFFYMNTSKDKIKNREYINLHIYDIMRKDMKPMKNVISLEDL